MSFVVAAASALMPTLSRVLERVIPDPEARARAELELIRVQQDGAFKELDAQLQVNLAQARINEVEAASQNGYQAGWRPLAGYACVSGLIYEFLIRPLLPWMLIVCGGENVPELPSLDGVLFELMFGMLGLGTLRSADRWSRVRAVTKIDTAR